MRLVNYTAFLYFLKGTTLIYAGQEFENSHLPSLFEREPIDRDTGRDMSALLARLHGIKRRFGCAGTTSSLRRTTSTVSPCSNAEEMGSASSVCSACAPNARR